MASLNLRDLYVTKGFSDLTIWAGSGMTKTKFLAHKVVICTAPGLRELLQRTEGDILELQDPATVIDRLLQWMYTVPWVGLRIDLEGEGLGVLGELARVAAKV